jgi:ubiquinone/menaquinone biosynthesis C-methylase UbiE
MNDHRRKPQNKPDTSWEKVASWYDQYVSEISDFHRDLIIPGVTELIPEIKDKNIIDIGCGQGVLCRHLAQLGATVKGIDASKKLIDIARNKSKHMRNVSYNMLSAEKLVGVPSAHYDVAISVLALQNMRDLESVIAEVSRVLKKGGLFIIVMNHPCFRIPRQSGWGMDEKRRLQYRRIDKYMSCMAIPIQMHPGDAPELVTWTFHRPLSVYIGDLSKNGMAVDVFNEWVSKRMSQHGKNANAENNARYEIPIFLAMRAIKIK